MKKVLLLIISLTFVLFAQTAEEELMSKIKYTLRCNAKYSNITDVEILITTPSTKYKECYLVTGSYKSTLAIGGNKGMFSMGDEFHPYSGSFKAIVDKNLELKKLKWKVGPLKGYVRDDCLKANEDDI